MLILVTRFFTIFSESLEENCWLLSIVGISDSFIYHFSVERLYDITLAWNVECGVWIYCLHSFHRIDQYHNSTDNVENGNLLLLLIDLIRTLTDGNIEFETFEFQISNAAKQFLLIWNLDFLSLISLQIAFLLFNIYANFQCWISI